MTAMDATDVTERTIDTYVQDVAAQLNGLEEEERAELLDDLRSHLREVINENPGSSLNDLVGTPESYAKELLASAGVVTTQKPKKQRFTHIQKRYEETTKSFKATTAGQITTKYATILAPAWWVARAYLLVTLVTSIIAGTSHSFYVGSVGQWPTSFALSYPGFPIPHLLGSTIIGFLAIIALIPLSVAIGQRSAEKSLTTPVKRIVTVSSVVLVVFGIGLMSYGTSNSAQVIYQNYATPQDRCLSNSANQHVTNLYPYGTDGKLLDNVLIYDQTGKPIDNLCPEYDEQGRRLVNEYGKDANGAAVYGIFPRKQAVEESSVGANGVMTPVTKPVPPPAVVIPQVVPGSTTGSITTTAVAVTTPTTAPTSATSTTVLSGQ